MNDSNFARQGINLWLNNQPEAANRHFVENERFAGSVQLQAGYTLISCMNSVISYEMDQIELAQSQLLKLEKMCTSEMGWMKSFRSMIFRNNDSSTGNGYDIDEDEDDEDEYAGSPDSSNALLHYLEKQIILADTQLCLGILTFLTQDFSGFMKGSWLLRKAWKIYHKTYSQIYEIYNSSEHGGSRDGLVVPPIVPVAASSSISSLDNEPPQSKSMRSRSSNSIKGYFSKKYDEFFRTGDDNDVVETSSCDRSGGATPLLLKKLTKSKTINFSDLRAGGNNNNNNNNLVLNPSRKFMNSNRNYFRLNNNSESSLRCDIDTNEVKRLMGAISFGYGLFQLAVSLLPPSLFRIISFFGFEGDRKIGVAALQYARRNDDMRAPLATLALLWYLTVGVQIFGFEDGKSPQEELQNAINILEQSQPEYAQASLFLFFKGRVDRLKSNIVESLESYELAYKVSPQNEIKLLCLHEIGWCYMIELNFRQSMLNFHQLGLSSKFSKTFYIYVTMILQGAIGRFDNLIKMKNDILAILAKSKQKDAQIEKFISRRLERLEECDKIFDKLYWRLLVYEMLYLWNALGNCCAMAMSIIRADCEGVSNEPVYGISKLILGACHICAKDYDEAVRALRECIDLRTRCNGETDVGGLHVLAYALYELASVLLKNEDSSLRDEGKQLLLKAQQLKGYDFENRLSIRIHQALTKF